eukprot:TRINITY_DN2402_c0_g1_i3.p1 TRINITY_DN2402_c0_g1~~TRINITY_DN2402_c0_g1_i3.p1  ORF type:complete len:307 (+),score=61.66 TRINITY_DN2402_c0_g1_i3:767-1687(+)
MRVQATRFACGGFSLGFALSHNVTDGWGFFRWLNHWAQTAAGREPHAVSCDRSLLYGRPDGPHGHHPEYKVNAPAPPPDPSKAPVAFAMPETQQMTFKLTRSMLDALKAEAQGHLGGDRTVSTNDVVTALFWRAVTRARGTPGETPIKLGFAVNGRRRFTPPVPDSYVGAATFYGLCDGVTASELVGMPLGEVAWQVRCAVNRMDDEHLRSALNWVSAQANKSLIAPGFNCFLAPDFSASSWVTFPMYDVDFGFGKPTYATVPNAKWDGFMVALPSRLGDGVEVLISLKTEHATELLKDSVLAQAI